MWSRRILLGLYIFCFVLATCAITGVGAGRGMKAFWTSCVYGPSFLILGLIFFTGRAVLEYQDKKYFRIAVYMVIFLVLGVSFLMIGNLPLNISSVPFILFAALYFSAILVLSNMNQDFYLAITTNPIVAKTKSKVSSGVEVAKAKVLTKVKNVLDNVEAAKQKDKAADENPTTESTDKNEPSKEKETE